MGIAATTLKDRYVPQIDKFTKGSTTYEDEEFGSITLTYADFKPSGASTATKKPLIIWFHGGGEGGTDTTIPLSANKACEFASDKTQSIFGGAYVLAPQTPTKWMDDGTKISKGTEKSNALSMYSRSAINLIEQYVKANPGVDASRIYIGGCSNGGFLTLRLLIDYPDYFAAAFPVCEGINDKFITDEEIQRIKDKSIWFVTSATDDTLPAPLFTLPTYDRLAKTGAKNVHLSYFPNIVDKTGLYKDADGNPHEYDGHWSWTYVYDNRPTNEINGKTVTLMEWMASQKK